MTLVSLVSDARTVSLLCAQNELTSRTHSRFPTAM
eukprot:COSAG04_NODE_30270_length_264_cov_0.527273_2_plen_34_part_01